MRREVKFNYTLDPDAQLLLDWFERLTETSMHVINLERTATLRPAGTRQGPAADFRSRRTGTVWSGASQLLPMLDRIAKNQSTFNRVRERAAALADAIRAGRTKTD